MQVAKLNWIKYEGLEKETEVITKIRYKDSGSLSVITPNTTGIGVRFFEKAKGIAPGQSAVFYEGNDVLGGGIIQRG
jgi:tRNA-specific 2-thiouridylase